MNRYDMERGARAQRDAKQGEGLWGEEEPPGSSLRS